MHFARSIAVLGVIASTAAAAEPCRIGSNMPGGDANPVKPIAAGQARMVCTEGVLTNHLPNGTTQQIRTWKFELKK